MEFALNMLRGRDRNEDVSEIGFGPDKINRKMLSDLECMRGIYLFCKERAERLRTRDSR